MADQAELEEHSAEAGGEAVAAIDDSPESGIESLRQQITASEDARRRAESERDDERRARESESQAREEAERRAQRASAEAQSRGHTAFEAQYDSVVNAHHAALGELAAQKTALKTAMAEGDFDKVADLSADIGVTASRVRQFEDGKAALEQQRKSGGYQQASGEDPQEAFLRTRTPRTAAWLRRNPRYFTDGTFQMAVTGAHNLAVARGITPDSDAYFQFVEEQAGHRPSNAAAEAMPAASAAASAAAVTAPRQSSAPAMPAAPAAGSTSTATRPNAGGRTITLTPEERDVCRINGISEAAYAKQKETLLAEKRIGVGH